MFSFCRFVSFSLGLLWLALATPAWGQSVLQGQIVAEAGAQAIPYATVTIVGTALGTVADETGRFRLVAPPGKPLTQQVRFSSLGFESIELPASALAEGTPLVRLAKSSVSLGEITVRPSTERLMTAGRNRGRASLTQDMYLKQNLIGAADTVRELGVLLRVPQAGLLQNANFEVAFNTFKRLTAQVQVYRWENNQPGAALLPAGVPVVVTQKRGWVRVDLRAAQVRVATNEAVVLALRLRRADTLNTDVNAFVLAATPRTRQQFLVRPGHARAWEAVSGAAPHLFATVAVTTPVPAKRRRQRRQPPVPAGQLQQAGELSYRALRTVSAADSDFADLDFLRQELRGRRVVFLGETTHGDGTAFEAKARLVRYLHHELGFTTLGLESGFYAVAQARHAIAAGQPARDCLRKSVFPVWMGAHEFQPVVADVAAGKLKVMGFDPQLTGAYSAALVDSLAKFLAPAPRPTRADWDFLRGVVQTMNRTFSFPATASYSRFQGVLAEASAALRAAAPGRAQGMAADEWRQCLVSLDGLARDYVDHNPAGKTAATFRAADSNPRDQLMADNLLWYLRQHPDEKIICWGATGHFANEAAALRDDEMAEFRPMGGRVHAALPGQAYTLGITAGEGEYALLGWAPAPVPALPEGSVEALLAAAGTPYAFVSTRQPFLQREAVSTLLDHQAYRGDWSRVLDGILYLQVMQPPTLAK